jgi:hypothetical protein
MAAGIGWLITVYVITTAAVMVLHLYVRWPWYWKAVAIGLGSAAYFLAYSSAPDLLGWPTSDQLPKKFSILGVMIEEPDASRDSEGAIYFWGADVSAGGDKTPRAYHVPYTPTLKAQFSEAHGKIRKNIPQIAEVEDPDAVIGTAQERSQLGQSSLKIKIKDAPAEGAPVKDAPE